MSSQMYDDYYFSEGSQDYNLDGFSPNDYPEYSNQDLDGLLNSVDPNMIQAMRKEAIDNKAVEYFPSKLNPDVSLVIKQMRKIMYPTNPLMYRTETTENPYSEFSTNLRLGQLIGVNGYADLINDRIGMNIGELIQQFDIPNTHPIQIAFVNNNHFVPVFNCTDPIMAQAYDEIFGDNYQNTDEFDAEFPNIYPNIRIPYVRHSGDCGPHSLLYAFLVARVYRKNLNAPLPPSNSSSDLSFFSLRPSSSSNSSWTDVVSSNQQTRKHSNKKKKGKSIRKGKKSIRKGKKSIRIGKRLRKRVTKKYK